jgi:hypothetical protein
MFFELLFNVPDEDSEMRGLLNFPHTQQKSADKLAPINNF